MNYKSKLYEVPQINSVQEMLLHSVDNYSNKLALEDLNQTPINKLTYSELFDHVLRFGNALFKLGYNERSHIAVIGENRVQWAITYLTGMVFNMVIVPIDKNLTPNEILNILHESDSECLVFSGSYHELFTEKKDLLKRVRNYISMDEPSDASFLQMHKLIKDSEPFDRKKLPRVNSDELAEIIFTSGSLGRAKGVMLSQGNLAANLIDMVSMLMMYPEDRFLSVLPMHHTYECTCGLLCPLYSGSSVHYARSLKTIVDDLQRVEATIILGVPLLYEKMFKRISKSINEDKVKSRVVPILAKVTNVTSKLGLAGIKKKVFKELHNRFGGSLRIFIAGGAAPDPLVAKGLREFGFNFLQGYGLTETSPILTLNRLDQFKDNAAGLPLPRVEIKINNPDEEGSGEVWAMAPNVMMGYYKNDSATNETFENGWFKTGDIGKIDEDGFLHICGRQKNVIISNSGKNIFPEEIEDILNRSPYILESAVYGEEDEKHDEVVAAQLVVDAEAFIALSESENIKITDELIQKYISDEIKEVNSQLAGYKQIKKYYIREDEFEKTTTHKIKRHLIKK